MSSKKYYRDEVPYRLNGIPCLIGVIEYQAELHGIIGNDPSMSHAPEDLYVSFDILDRKGYRAKWLERKMTPAIESDIEFTVDKYMRENTND